MQLIMIRHGESTENHHGRLSGQIDSELSGTGIKQARAVAERLRPMAFAHIYSSDLKRAVDTATPIAACHAAAVDRQAWLRERHAGVLQGLTKAQRKRLYPDEHKAWKSSNPMLTIAGGGESGHDFRHRVVSGLQQLSSKHLGQTVLLVTHAGVLREVFNFVFDTQQNGNRIRCGNTALCRFRFEPTLWSMECWGDTAHLQSSPQH